MRKIVSLSLLILITAFLASEVSAQQLREVARQVDTSVVVINTVEKNLLATPQSMMKVWDQVNGLKPGDVIAVKVLRGGTDC